MDKQTEHLVALDEKHQAASLPMVNAKTTSTVMHYLP